MQPQDMMQKNRSNSYSISSRLKSFRDAGRGLIALVASEPNARTHLLVAQIVIIAGFANCLIRPKPGTMPAIR